MDKPDSPLIAKLKAHKAANAGTYDHPLSECGVIATIPKFINHGRWMRAQRVGKGDQARIQAAYIAEVVLFDGEKITLTDLAELVPAGDMLELIGKLFGDDDTEGNGKEAA